MHRICFYLCLTLLTSCSVINHISPQIYANKIAAQNGWQAVEFQTNRFTLHGFHGDLSSAEKKLIVYIEGDGHAWKNRWRPSTDPTPRNPIALRLAVQAPESKVLYLARPCQFTTDSSQTHCLTKYWTSHRYSQEVIDSVNEALDQAKVLSDTKQMVLIGYSGGGTLAALLAAQRKDIAHLVTISANLDTDVWVKEHGVTPLQGSLNPVDFAAQLSHIPQIHLSGANDEIVSPTVLQSYIEKLPGSPLIQWALISDYDHQCCWVEAWQELHAKYLDY